MGKAAAKRYSHFTCAFYAISLEAVNAKDPEWASIHAQARLHVLAAGKGVLTGVQRLQP
jgi:hypothetical protein